jgi:hypothetical protein
MFEAEPAGGNASRLSSLTKQLRSFLKSLKKP